MAKRALPQLLRSRPSWLRAAHSRLTSKAKSGVRDLRRCESGRNYLEWVIVLVVIAALVFAAVQVVTFALGIIPILAACVLSYALGRYHQHKIESREVPQLSFKPNTDDMREAPSLELSSQLQAAGAIVHGQDPIAEANASALDAHLNISDVPLEAVRGADAVVLVTEWAEYTATDWTEVAAVMNGKLVVDGRNALDANAIRAAGLTYEGIGRPNS